MQTPALWVCVALMTAGGLAAGAEPPSAAKPELSGRGLAADKAVTAFYQQDEVQSVHLSVAEADMNRMVAALPELIEVPATFRWRDVTVENVAVRFKGNSSSSPKQTHKRS
ncbi:MAG: hypothetical protein WCH43_13240, partial [Verrucomicrobiota bacterium]